MLWFRKANCRIPCVISSHLYFVERIYVCVCTSCTHPCIYPTFIKYLLCAGHCAKGWVDSVEHGVWGRERDPCSHREVTEEMTIVSRQQQDTEGSSHTKTKRAFLTQEVECWENLSLKPSCGWVRRRVVREEVGMYMGKSRKLGKKLLSVWSAGERNSGRCGEEGVEWRKEILLFTSFPSPQVRLTVLAISMYFVIGGGRD